MEATMAKEAKLGIALIAVLLGAFGVALYSRLKQAKSAEVAVAAEEPTAAAAEPEKPKLASGPLKSTAAPQASGGRSTTDFTSTTTSTGSSSASGSSSRHGGYGDSDINTKTAAPGDATKDPFAGSNPVTSSTAASNPAVSSTTSSRPADRYGDRYGSASQQIYGPNTGSDSASTATIGEPQSPTTSPSQSSDPFNRYGGAAASGNSLTPTADASAALLPASATVDSPPADTTTTTLPTSAMAQPAEAGLAESSPSAAENPLRREAVEKSAASSRSNGPRYDLYGSGAASNEAAKTEPTTTEPATNARPATSADSATSRVRFGPSSGGDRRYSDATPSAVEQTAAEERATPAPLTEPSPSSRYSTPAIATGGSAAASGASQDSSTTGWSGTSSRGVPSHVAPAQPASATSPRAPRPLPAATIQRGDSYVVEPNDSFSSISTKVYGTDAYFKALHEHNKARFPRADQLRTGDVVATPSAEMLTQKYPGLCPKASHVVLPARTSALTSQRGGGRVYVVEEGDTLFDIARFELGKATRWAEIYELNKETIGQDFNHLRPGTQLTLPADLRDDNFTRRPGVGVPR